MSQINYLDILQNGLTPSNLAPKNIVIIGAGIAGLMAGLLLKEAGHHVTILEAHKRLGGRILTYRGFAGKMYGEFGAMRFPQQHPLAQYLINEKFKLPTKPFPIYDENTFIHLQGKSVRRSDFHPHQFDFNLPNHEANQTPEQLLKNAVQPLIDIVEGEDKESAWQHLVKDFDQYSLIGYLKFRGLSEAALSLLGSVLNLESRYHFSLVEWFTHYYEDVFGDLVYITDGADSLPKAFEPYLMNNIRMGSQVCGIEQTDNQVIIHFQTSPGFTRSIKADECIITIPFNMLRHLEISGLDPAKWSAIRNSYYGSAHKIFMQFSDRWWENNYAITHGVTITDLAIRQIVYTPAGQDYHFQKGVIIASYGWEQDSMVYSPLSEEQRVTQALEDLAKIHPEAKDTFEFGVSYDWSLDAFAGGIGSLFRPYEMSSKFYVDLIRPVNRIWFANDACDRSHRRWIEGSLRAAIKNAYALHIGMKNELPGKD
ncbi:MAG: NAD(P)/FAD-dependent oxidoreductase [Crocosphaera sp.]|jgi:monoamine oxidase